MVQVNIPFKVEFLMPIRHGRKVMTSRSKVMGNIGDEFDAFGHIFQITEVFQARLKDVAEKYWELEGVKSPEEFVEVWKKIHPINGFQPEKIVWVHRFKKIRGD